MNKYKTKKTLYVLAKLGVFLLILFLLDLSLGHLLRNLYFKQDSGYLYRTTYSLDSTKAGFLIFGSSTANHHYNTRIFETRMHTSIYNTGRDGNTIFYNYAIFQSVQKRYIPQIAILDFNVGEFRYMEESYDRISSLLPYYRSHPEIRSIIQLRSPFEKYKLISKIYPFNSLLFSIGVGNTDFNKTRDKVNDEQGYLPLTQVWNKTISTDTRSENYELDQNKINIFKSFVMECIAQHIRLYIVISPRFIKYSEDPSIQTVRDIAQKYNQPFYNFSKDTLFWKHPEYFADKVHLNDKGAQIFSNKVIDRILKDESLSGIDNKYSISELLQKNNHSKTIFKKDFESTR
jgi:hypothetical protein